MPKETRYTANVRIVKIEEGEEYDSNLRKNRSIDKNSEVATVTVRAKTLEELRAKAVKHVELIDE